MTAGRPWQAGSGLVQFGPALKMWPRFAKTFVTWFVRLDSSRLGCRDCQVLSQEIVLQRSKANGFCSSSFAHLQSPKRPEFAFLGYVWVFAGMFFFYAFAAWLAATVFDRLDMFGSF